MSSAPNDPPQTGPGTGDHSGVAQKVLDDAMRRRFDAPPMPRVARSEVEQVTRLAETIADPIQLHVRRVLGERGRVALVPAMKRAKWDEDDERWKCPGCAKEHPKEGASARPPGTFASVTFAPFFMFADKHEAGCEYRTSKPTWHLLACLWLQARDADGELPPAGAGVSVPAGTKGFHAENVLKALEAHAPEERVIDGKRDAAALDDDESVLMLVLDACEQLEGKCLGHSENVGGTGSGARFGW